MAIGSNLPPADLSAKVANAQKRTANSAEGGEPVQKAQQLATVWGATGANTVTRPSADLSTKDLVNIMGTQVSSLNARWGLRPRQNGEAQPDWEATVKIWADSRATASANSPDVDKLCGTIAASVERLQTLATDPKSSEIVSLYQGLADAVAPLTGGKDSFNVPDAIKARLFETMLPALDHDLLSKLTQDKSGALNKQPPGFLFKSLGAPLFDAVSHLKPELSGQAFMAAASSVAAEPDHGTRKELTRGLGNAVLRMYPDVPRDTAPEARLPPVGNNPVLMQLFAPQIARATFFQGALPDVLVKRDYGSGEAKINWPKQLAELAKGGGHATQALTAIASFMAAQPPKPPPARAP